jgi:hypothetical protein
MKKIITLAIVAAGIGAYAANYTPASSESAQTISATVTVGTGGSILASGTGFVAATAQADTNATTSVTTKTPKFIGQILVGGAGTGTNGVWIAKGLTTNDWVAVAP